MSICNIFHYSTSIEDALQTLGNSKGIAKVLAGGTDLILDLQQGRHSPVDTLVDITNIPELNVLEYRDQKLFIGASVPHRMITNSPDVISHSQALAEASGLIGGPQVRNVATLGGNVAHALPAADGTIALMAMDAKAEIATLEGRRMTPLKEIFRGPGKSTLDPKKELLVGFYLSKKIENAGSSFKRIMRPQGVAIAILNCGLWLEREGNIVKDIRISIGPSGPVPRRLIEVENSLRGKQPSTEAITEANIVLQEEANFRTSRHRASEEYRKEMAAVLLKNTLLAAWERSGAEGEFND
ncbi:MAG: hypothetical protein HON98_00475 [Chloroflexi bacterium]|jgi:xanthine dehydrogenase FAD-binding subunit|nr:hypothetical protein [Chloroflexota bacterium]MBT4004181.1 hypothetical protein [Chloroflexota bacterium]MBT4306642.1 hypothetical protein [Chloroflexota bacterium]MBT4533782.1 hypothetical protein [Chloroflexota bacterium]MBT4681572.1 hypothetical protein [Chloroflexota bacterium]